MQFYYDLINVSVQMWFVKRILYNVVATTVIGNAHQIKLTIKYIFNGVLSIIIVDVFKFAKIWFDNKLKLFKMVW